MAVWQVDEYDLALLHLDPAFHRALLRCVDHWLRRAVDVRNQIYLNATDNTRHDQWTWMQRYEDMLTELAGEHARFLPRERTRPKEKPGDSTRNDSSPADGDGDDLIAIG